MNPLLLIASMVAVGSFVAAGLVLAGFLARKLASAPHAAFWRGPGSTPVLLSLFAPWLALTTAILMRLNGEFAFASSLLMDVAMGGAAGAVSATAELGYLRSRPQRWRRAHDAATLVALVGSAVYVAAVPPHSTEQFWSFLAALGIARFLVLVLRAAGVQSGEGGERAPA